MSRALRQPRRASWRHLVGVSVVGLLLFAFAPSPATSGAAVGITSNWIVTDVDGQGIGFVLSTLDTVGGLVLQQLSAANSVEASLTPLQAYTLELLPGIVVTPDVQVSLQSTMDPATPLSRAPSDAFLAQTGATSLWSKNDTGQGINVAVLDTGISALPDFKGRLVGGVDLTGENSPFQDDYGHGTFVAGLIAGNGASSAGAYEGEAPGAGLVAVKVADANGETDLATVIEGIDWVIAHQASLGIRVLNLSLGFVPFTSAYLNPLDLAVQTAWNDGIVVVVSAGNAGPFNGTIMSPGDDPYVITVGAVDDLGQANPSDDQSVAFSSVGPTDPDGLMKPDLVAPGRSVVSLADPGSTIYDENPSAIVGTSNFVGSGTSFSAAITSGAAALLLEQHPKDTPNQVKAALLASATPGPTGDPFVDGHGVLNAAAASALGGVSLSQDYGSVLLSGSMDGALKVEPGDSLRAGYSFSMPGAHALAEISLVDPQVLIPLSCTNNGAVAGSAAINLSSGPYLDPAGDAASFPTNDQNAAASFQGSATAPNLCGGAAMYVDDASFVGEVVSVDTSEPIHFQFHYGDAAQPSQAAGWSPTASLAAINPDVSGGTISMSVPWAQSTWNPANWSGLHVPPQSGSVPSVSGLAWNGTAWNGTAWNGTAWNGTAWNGTAWNGTAWNGTAWNGTAWNGTAWNGTAWNGTAWNGSAWS